jgi:hypothetical protein
VFVKNTNATSRCWARPSASPRTRRADHAHALETTVNGTGTATDRRTVPASAWAPSTTRPRACRAPTSPRAPRSASGWKLTLPAGDAPHRTTYDLAIAGSTYSPAQLSSVGLDTISDLSDYDLTQTNPNG